MMKFVVLFALVAVASAKMNFKDCGKGELQELDISDCSGDTCVVHKGQKLALDATFDANQDTTKVQIKVFTTVAGTKIAVHGVETDGCKILKCPLKKGSAQVFQYLIVVPAILPNIKADVTAELIGDHGVLACGTVHVEVK